MKQGMQGLRFMAEGLRLGIVLICLVQFCSPLFSQTDSTKYPHAPQISKAELDSVAIIDLQKALQGKLNCPSGSTKDSTKNNPAPHLEGSIPNHTIRNKQRIRLVTAGNIVGYGGTMWGLYSAWYKNYPQTSFHFFNDNKEWLQVDKVGHMYSAYIESKASLEMWRWAGMERKKRIWIGGLSGAAYQTVIEVLDGFSEGWGWSWGDFAANVAGSGLLIGQELAWDDQRIQFKFSFHKKNYGEAQLNQRADNLYGTSLAERMLKDYNGQTYWLSANLKSFFKQSNLPAWLNVAVGYGAEDMFGGTTNSWKDPVSGININRNDISRYRQWYIAPDVDLTKIKTNSKFLKTAFFVLNAFKFPAPSLGMSKKGLQVNWIHF